MSRWTTYGKALVWVAVAALTVLASTLTDGHVNADEGVQIAIATTTAASVWLVPNLPQWPWVKTTLMVILAVLNLAVSMISGGISPQEWVNLALAGLGVLVGAAAPARSAGTGGGR
jgi:hypothetical protein